MLKTSSIKSAEPRKGIVRVDVDSRVECDGNELDGSKIGNNKIDDKVNNEVGKKDQKTFKSKKLSKSKKTVGLDFFISGAWLAFTKLRQAFVKALILYHFDPEHHI